MVARGQNFQAVELNIVGSSTFGKYPKISQERTYNMFISDDFLVPYSGYEIAVSAADLMNGKVGRGIFTSIKLNKLVVVIDQNVFLVTLTYNQQNQSISFSTVLNIGQLQTTTGFIYIAENNKPQIAITDGQAIYIYDESVTPHFFTVTNFGSIPFTPGYITFHDTYFICASLDDSDGVTNRWRLSMQNDGSTWPSTAGFVGSLQTKPDKIQAVVRFPSKGNMIFVMGRNVTEAWFDTGGQTFPYSRTTQFNIDYGCVSPATVAYSDELVVWLAQNEKSGPIILYSDGGMPHKITTDGIDQLFSTLQNPQDSQAFIYRQDGHLFYHINFYSDNLSLFYDFNTNKFYHACDQNMNYFIAAEVAFFQNQYYFVTPNNGNMFSFDTIFTTYEDVFPETGIPYTTEIPRFRICKNIRQASQDYFIANDVGFTIETGETNWQQQNIGPGLLITQSGNPLITQGAAELFESQDGILFLTQDNNNLQAQQINPDNFNFFITNQDFFFNATPCVDLSISTDGGATFGNDQRYILNPIGLRKNRLMWWQQGIVNDLVCQFKFWGLGRVVCTNGVVNIRT